MAINRYRLKHLANSGHRGAKLAQKLEADANVDIEKALDDMAKAVQDKLK